MGISEILGAIWNLPHWWDVLVVAIVDDALFLAKLIVGFISWWYVWLILIGLIAIYIYGKKLIKRIKRRKRKKSS